MLRSRVPVVAVSAVRTGCGKSQTARYLVQVLREQGERVGVMRHPMPYGDLEAQVVQRFASIDDIDAAGCTLEEREEYEPHVAAGAVMFAGVDYRAVLDVAERHADVLVWDGGNNDFPFVRPDVHVVLVDALRPDHLTTHYPGEGVLRCADVVVINKADVASPAQLAQARAGVDAIRPNVPVVVAASPIRVADPERLDGARVMVVEDGPTITHGGMSTGAGYQAAEAANVSEIIDPRPFAAPEIAPVYRQYPHIGPVLPAMGYGAAQIAGLRATIEAARPDVVVAGTPIDLDRALGLRGSVVRVYYDYADTGEPGLGKIVGDMLGTKQAAG